MAWVGQAVMQRVQVPQRSGAGRRRISFLVMKSLIRATVARFPYLQVERNDKIDVETIPRPQAAKVE